MRLDALEAKYRDYELGFAYMTGGSYFDRDAFDFLRTAPTRASALMSNFNAVFRADAQERAFGKLGEPGDAARIMHLAERFVDTYESFLDEAARIRGASLAPEFREAQEAAALFGAEAVEQIRDFVNEVVESMSTLPELGEGRSDDDEPAVLSLTCTLTANTEVMKQFVRSSRSGLIALGYEVGPEDDLGYDTD